MARVSKLERELKETERHRQTQRKSRERSEIPQVSIVGYTNAGKSTLLNALTDAGVLVEDRLFATLDSTVRRLELPNHRPIVLADTVGFVRHLPHHLVEAFQSTLAEVAEADLLLHIVDGSDQDPAGQIAAVREVLEEIGAAEVPELIVFNKADLISDQALTRLTNLYPDSVVISALKGDGLDDLLAVVGEFLDKTLITLTLELPYTRGDLVAAAHRLGEVIEEKHDDNGTILEVRLPETARSQFAPYSR
jgi:GTP-binding protein HflX